MAPRQLRALEALEGHCVGVAVRGGDRIDACQLVSVGRGGTRTLWLFADGADRFVPFEDVLDLWEGD